MAETVKPQNPFTPRFGSLPPVLGGREDLLDRLSRAQDNLNAPEGAALLIGPRGMGMTAVLRAVAGEASERGWDVISISTADGSLPSAVAGAVLRRMPDESDRWRLSNVSAAGVGFSRSQSASQEVPAVRCMLLDLADRARDRGAGVLLAVDELHAAEVAEARELASAIQHVSSGDGQPLVFIGSGLPEMASTILDDRGMTFFRRCHRAELGVISDGEARRAIQEAVLAAGGSIDGDALLAAVESAAGYPYRIQLVGFHAWERCGDPGLRISAQDVRYACEVADADAEAGLASSPLRGLSTSSRGFLAAMGQHGPTVMGDIVRRTGGSSRRANHHRLRLIEAGLIADAGRGKVEHARAEARFWLTRDSRTASEDSTETAETADTKQCVIKELQRKPRLSYAQIGRDLDISRTHVGNIAVEAGLERNTRPGTRR